ncbi:MAG TPA: polyphosphate kinase 2 family protein [Candidatus Hydrogenedentes bacterium]|nr:polyphosphate kinase 2 family protein [Candidatus Hydrogenedentota bacterium]HOS03087.1 polyphosphate kinase 2 family protein [Candidatus Hydrogenedentota bacterium]
MKHAEYLVPPGRRIRIEDFDSSFTGRFRKKEDAQAVLDRDIRRLSALQDVLYAQNTYALLVIFQAMDAAGKDGAIKHVMSGVNPQGVQVFSFKAPSEEELDHDYLWRCMKALPERGRIGIFNRSYYEEVLVARVHPEILERQRIPKNLRTKDIWKDRFEDINNFERYLTRNGIVVLKFFLNVSKDEQRQRFLDRINAPAKNWKFSSADVAEREYWDEYMNAYEDVFSHTSTKWAPWHIVPADHKWFTRVAVADIIVSSLEGLKLKYPKVSEEAQKALQEQKRLLEKQAGS